MLIERGALDAARLEDALARQRDAPPRDAPADRIDPVELAAEAFLRMVGWRDILDDAGLARVRELRRELAEAGLVCAPGGLAVELGLVAAAPVAAIETHVERKLERPIIGAALPRLTLDAEQRALLTEHLRENPALAAAALNGTDAVIRIYHRAGIRRHVGEVLVEMGIVDARTIARALEVQRIRQRLATRRRSTCDGPRYALEVVAGDAVGRRLDFDDGAFVVGRKRCDLALADRRASKAHARVAVEDGIVVVTDLGSRNGTRVGGRRVHRAALKPGEELRIGRSVIRFRDALHAGPAPEAPAASVEPAGLPVDEDTDTDELDVVDDLVEIGLGGPGAAEELEQVRLAFSEFYEREQLLLDGKADAPAPPTLEQALEVRALGSGQRSSTRLAAAFAAAALVVAAGAWAFVHSSRARQSRITAAARARREPPPPPVVRTAPPAAEIGAEIEREGVIVSSQRYTPASQAGPTLFGLVLDLGDEGYAVVQATTVSLGVASSFEDLQPGIRIRVRGRVRAFAGRPVALPDGRSAAHYVDAARIVRR